MCLRCAVCLQSHVHATPVPPTTRNCDKQIAPFVVVQRQCLSTSTDPSTRTHTGGHMKILRVQEFTPRRSTQVSTRAASRINGETRGVGQRLHSAEENIVANCNRRKQQQSQQNVNGGVWSLFVPSRQHRYSPDKACQEKACGIKCVARDTCS